MPRKAVHEHELTSLSTDDSDRLLESQHAGKTASAGPISNSRIRDFLRHVRILLPGVLVSRAFSWMSPIEQRKVAAYQSRRMAILNSLLHLVPFIGATALLVLFWTKHWIGGASDNATTLQFVAKFHELLMQASLVDILLYIIRAQALEGYIPLGVLSGAAQAPQISYLWSLDFVSALKSPHFLLWRRIIFGISAAALLFMASVVGPSSAVLMIPRPDMTYEQGAVETVSYHPEGYLFPTELNSTHGLDFLRYAFLAKRTDFSAAYVFRPKDPDKGNTYIWPKDALVPPPTYELADPAEIEEVIMWSSIDPKNFYEAAVATTPTSLAAAQIMRSQTSFIRISDVEMRRSAAIRTVHPLVSTNCHVVYAEDLKDFGEWINCPSRNGSIIRLSTFAEVEQTHWSNLTLRPSDYHADAYPPLWKVAPDDPESLVGVFLVQGGRFGLMTCLISSYWWMSEALLAYVSDPPRRRLTPEIPHLSNSGTPMMDGNLRPIVINPADIRSLNSKTFAINTTSSGAASLAMVWADALSALPYIQYDRVRLDSHHQPPSSWSHYTTNEMYTGFGYGSTDTPSILAAAVITAYCLISLLFIAYIISTGHTSIAWNSAMELIVLALQSEEPDGLGHVSVGLDSMDTFRRTVGTRVNTVPVGDTGETRERLELVFEHDKDAEKRGLTKVVRNRAY